MSLHVTDQDDFNKKLEEAGSKLVIVDFYATWCGPCKMIAPILEQMVTENPNLVVLKVDVDECEDLAQDYNISAMPTFIFIKNKTKVDTLTGANPEKLKALAASLQ